MKQATLEDLKLELWLRQRKCNEIIWTTKDGAKISIKDLTEQHLINIINLLSKKESDILEENWFYSDLIGDGDNIW